MLPSTIFYSVAMENVLMASPWSHSQKAGASCGMPRWSTLSQRAISTERPSKLALRLIPVNLKNVGNTLRWRIVIYFARSRLRHLDPLAKRPVHCALAKDIGRRLFLATGELRCTSFLVQRVSDAVQRGNAASVLATVPQSSKFHEIYLIN